MAIFFQMYFEAIYNSNKRLKRGSEVRADYFDLMKTMSPKIYPNTYHVLFTK